MNRFGKNLMNRPTWPSTSPWRSLSQMDEEIQRWLGHPGLDYLGQNGMEFAPQCDLRETEKEYVAKVDLPGVKKEDVKIEIDGNQLRLSGERKEEKEDKTDKHHFKETFSGSFTRSFNFPSDIDESKIDAKFKEGVLEIHVPKRASSKARQISIN